MISYWRFEDDYKDSVGSNHGTPAGNPTFVPGKIGKAINLGGLDDYIDMGSASELRISKALTMSFWMYGEGNSIDAGLAGTGISNYACTHHRSYKIYCYIQEGRNHVTFSLPNDEWHHVAYSWDGTTDRESIKLYVDGMLKNTRTSTKSEISGWQNFLIGKSTTNFKGKIDEVKVWNYALSEVEVKKEYERTNLKTEKIEIYNEGYDLMKISFNEHRANNLTTVFAKNELKFFELMKDADNRNISVREMEVIHAGDYVVVGNEDDGYLLKLGSTANSSTSGTSNDRVRFIDVATGQIIDTVWDSEGAGTITVGGYTYRVYMKGSANKASEQRDVRLNYPDSSGRGDLILYPTIQTYLGAQIMFYEKHTIDLMNWDGNNNQLKELLIPDGDGYERISFTPYDRSGNSSKWNVSADGVNVTIDTRFTNSNITVRIGELSFFINGSGTKNKFKIVLVGEKAIFDPALVIIEEKDAQAKYHALIVSLESGYTTDDGIGVDKVESTSNLTLVNRTNKTFTYKDVWGSKIIEDDTDGDQRKATIIYPDNQII